MTTADLIAHLAADTRPVRYIPPHRPLVAALCVGGLITLSATLIVFGMQPDLFDSAHLIPFAMKGCYALALAGPSLVLALTLARPDARSQRIWTRVAIPAVVLAMIAVWQLTRASSELWPEMILGGTARQCPIRIAVLSLPILAGLLFAIRQQAPVRLQAAGIAAGLVAGATSAMIYALACTEATAAFVLIWYSLGIGVSALLGGLLGPRVLHW